MRDIKFRGKRVEDGAWVYGSLSIHPDACFISNQNAKAEDSYAFTYEVDPSTVGQYTGHHYENGDEVYEGDIFRNETHLVNTNKGRAVPNSDFHNDYIVEFNSDIDINSWIATIVKTTRHNNFGVGYVTKGLYFTHSCTILGNIHDNPELLK